MINLKIHTEYSFRYAYGKIKEIVTNSHEVVSMTDRNTTFGHIPFWKECKKQNKKCILGVELAFVQDAKLKVRQATYYVTLLAINQKGLSKIYELTSKASTQKYYFNRLSFKELQKIAEKDVVVIFENSYIAQFLKNRKNTYYGISPMTVYNDYKAIKDDFNIVAISNNLYDVKEHEALYQIILGYRGKDKNSVYESRTELSHILSEEEWKEELYWLTEEEKKKAIENTSSISSKIDEIEFEKAELPKQGTGKTLRELCIEGCKIRGIDLTNKDYCKRINKELDLIEQKNYEEYFFLTKDLVDYAKKHMLVGPGRGSAGGSLVCYLLGITEIDPLKFGLIFERFIDINRKDLPDIDIDFQDDKVYMCIEYLKNKYGSDCVAKLGTLIRYKPKITLVEISKILNVPSWKMKDLKDNIIIRGAGDKRSDKCLEDTFKNLDIGQNYINKYPGLIYSQYIENHIRHTGKHAGGIVVSNKPLHNYCSVNLKDEVCLLDKRDAEIVNLLKMDCLSVSELTVIKNCLDAIGKDREWLINYRLDDKKVFDIVNDKKSTGIFQFGGYALKGVARKIDIKSFDDICALTALARPGPLGSGGTEAYVKAKNSNNPKFLPKCEKYTKETYGVIVYQEQFMFIIKDVGKLSWEDTSILRKAMSKSYGEEFFEQYFEKFKKGCLENGLTLKEIKKLWKSITSMGKYAFNKAHSVAYAMLSYWCMVLKCYYPLEFVLETLRKNTKNPDKIIQLLKELEREGYKFKPFDKDLSEIDWCIKNNVLIGGYINIKGIGPKKAEKIIQKRKDGKALTVCENLKIYNAVTPYDCIFDCKEKYGDYYKNWKDYFREKPTLLKDIDGTNGEVRFLAKITSIKLRDVNEDVNVKKREGKVIKYGCLKYLDVTFSDDTDIIKGRINRDLYKKYGESIFKNNDKGKFFIVRGWCCDGFRYIIVKKIKKINEKSP